MCVFYDPKRTSKYYQDGYQVSTLYGKAFGCSEIKHMTCLSKIRVLFIVLYTVMIKVTCKMLIIKPGW